MCVCVCWGGGGGGGGGVGLLNGRVDQSTIHVGRIDR